MTQMLASGLQMRLLSDYDYERMSEEEGTSGGGGLGEGGGSLDRGAGLPLDACRKAYCLPLTASGNN